MKYSIDDILVEKETGFSKKIIDIENIEGFDIYYMDDNTSYSELNLDQNFKTDMDIIKEEFLEKINNNFHIIQDRFKNNAEAVADGMIKMFKIETKNSSYKRRKTFFQKIKEFFS